MPIAVHFRGPMLFVTEDDSGPEGKDTVDRVIIPDAAAKSVHDDGSVACPHNARMLVRRPNHADEYIDLRGASITIKAANESHAPRVDGTFLLVPPLHRMTNPDNAASAAVRHRPVKQPGETTISFEGGRMTGDPKMIDDQGLELPEHLNGVAVETSVCSMPMWTSQSATGSITGMSPAGPIDVALDASTEVYIFHWDSDRPTPDQLRERLTDLLPFQDNDFKWVYSLLSPPAGADWKKWLATDPYFPAPRSVGYLQAPIKEAALCLADLAVGKTTFSKNAKTMGAASLHEVKAAGTPSSPVSTCDSSRIRGLKLMN